MPRLRTRCRRLAGGAAVLAGLLPLPGVPLPIPGGPSTPAAPAPPRPSRSPLTVCGGLTPAGPIAPAAPVFPCDFSDPMVLRAGRTWFGYATASGWETGGRTFPILRSSDMRHWRYAGDVFAEQPAWSAGDLWSPSVVAWRGRFLLYYSGRDRHGRHCVAVAVARRPGGPFSDRGPIACRARVGSGFIDPAPLAAPGRRLFLYFSVDAPRHAIAGVRLSRDGLRTAGRVVRLFAVSRRWGRLVSPTVEGPSPLYRRGRYVLFYSAGSWAADYRMSYAVARAPLGRYGDRAPVALVGASKRFASPGGGSVVTGPRRTTWLAFDAWSGPPGYGYRSMRLLHIAPVRWDRRDRPRLVLGGGSG